MMSLQQMTVLLLFAPLLSTLIALTLPFSRSWIRISAVSISLLTLVLITIISFQPVAEPIRWVWISLGANTIDLIFEFNNLTIPLAIAVSFISLLVNIYSIGFFKWDNNQPRYFATLSLFTFSMLSLTLSGNLLQTFVSWELVGITSYLLISFYRTKSEAVAAGTKALIMNKIGDVGFIIALMAIYVQYKSLEISELESLSVQPHYSLIIGIGLMLAAFSKSAQFPFHTWLPDAMEGPTPISALIHSATMVAAGVFLIIRLHVLFTPELLQVITIIGTITAIIGGIQALRDGDLKKILAWSTVSQLGLMIMVAGFDEYTSTFTHLLSHAIFKAGLFLMAGIVISTAGSNNVLDIKNSRKSGLLILASIILVITLMGLPLTIGFISKEYLISSISSPLYMGVFFLIQTLSILYSARIFNMIYPINRQDKPLTIESIFMIAPVVVLSVCSIWIIYSPSPLSAQLINETWNLNPPAIELTIFSAIWGILWFVLALYLVRKNKIESLLNRIPDIKKEYGQIFLVKPFLFATQITDRVDNKIIDKGIHGFVYVNFSVALFLRWLEKNWIDRLVQFTGWLIRAIGNFVRLFVAGKIQGYIGWTLVALIILFILSR